MSNTSDIEPIDWCTGLERLAAFSFGNRTSFLNHHEPDAPLQGTGHFRRIDDATRPAAHGDVVASARALSGVLNTLFSTPLTPEEREFAKQRLQEAVELSRWKQELRVPRFIDVVPGLEAHNLTEAIRHLDRIFTYFETPLPFDVITRLSTRRDEAAIAEVGELLASPKRRIDGRPMMMSETHSAVRFLLGISSAAVEQSHGPAIEKLRVRYWHCAWEGEFEGRQFVTNRAVAQLAGTEIAAGLALIGFARLVQEQQDSPSLTVEQMHRFEQIVNGVVKGQLPSYSAFKTARADLDRSSFPAVFSRVMEKSVRQSTDGPNGEQLRKALEHCVATVSDIARVHATFIHAGLSQPFDPAWRTETVCAVASKMKASGKYPALPILADALEEAGCTDSVLLFACRVTGTRERNRWIVAHVLGTGS